MAKTIPMIITNSDILVKDRDTDDFKTFSLPCTPVVANIPFYHHYAAKISETQHYFKEFIKSMYGKMLSKNILAILVPLHDRQSASGRNRHGRDVRSTASSYFPERAARPQD